MKNHQNEKVGNIIAVTPVDRQECEQNKVYNNKSVVNFVQYSVSNEKVVKDILPHFFNKFKQSLSHIQTRSE